MIFKNNLEGEVFGSWRGSEEGGVIATGLGLGEVGVQSPEKNSEKRWRPVTLHFEDEE